MEGVLSCIQYLRTMELELVGIVKLEIKADIYDSAGRSQYNSGMNGTTARGNGGGLTD